MFSRLSRTYRYGKTGVRRIGPGDYIHPRGLPHRSGNTSAIIVTFIAFIPLAFSDVLIYAARSSFPGAELWRIRGSEWALPLLDSSLLILLLVTLIWLSRGHNWRHKARISATWSLGALLTVLLDISFWVLPNHVRLFYNDTRDVPMLALFSVAFTAGMAIVVAAIVQASMPPSVVSKGFSRRTGSSRSRETYRKREKRKAAKLDLSDLTRDERKSLRSELKARRKDSRRRARELRRTERKARKNYTKTERRRIRRDEDAAIKARLRTQRKESNLRSAEFRQRYTSAIPLVFGIAASYFAQIVWDYYLGPSAVRASQGEGCRGAIDPEYFAQLSQVIPVLLIAVGIDAKFFDRRLQEPIQRAMTIITVATLCIAEMLAISTLPLTNEGCGEVLVGWHEYLAYIFTIEASVITLAMLMLALSGRNRSA